MKTTLRTVLLAALGTIAMVGCAANDDPSSEANSDQHAAGSDTIPCDAGHVEPTPTTPMTPTPENPTTTPTPPSGPAPIFMIPVPMDQTPPTPHIG